MIQRTILIAAAALALAAPIAPAATSAQDAAPECASVFWLEPLAAETTEQVQDLIAEAQAEYRERVSADEEIEIVDVVEEEPPPPPPKRPWARRGRAATARTEG